MKILHVNHSDGIGGAARAALRIHKSLLAYGVNSSFGVNKKILDEPFVIGPSNTLSRVINETRPLLVNALCRLLFEERSFRSLSILPSVWPRFINSSDFSVVHLHWIQAETVSIGDVKKITRPIVWTLHDMWPFLGCDHYVEDEEYQKGFKKGFEKHSNHQFFSRWILKRKKVAWKNDIHFVACSAWLLEKAKGSYLLQNHDVRLINYPIDTNFWRPLDKTFCRNAIGISQTDRPIILFTALNAFSDHRKGFDLLNSAIVESGLAQKVEVVVVGQGLPQGASYDYSITVFPKMTDDIAMLLFYNAADFIIVPSRQEAFGQVASEALACGKPVLASNVGGLPDSVRHKSNGFLFNPKDLGSIVESLAWAIKLYGDDNKYFETSTICRESILSRFSYPIIAHKYLELYKELSV